MSFEIHLTMAAGNSRNAHEGVVEATGFQIEMGIAQGGLIMERYAIKQLPSGFWSVWEGDQWLNASLPSREAAEKFIQAFKSSVEDEFDLPAFLLGEIYPNMDAEECAAWSIADARDLSHDLQKDGIEADAEEIYETIAEFIAQDAEDDEL